MRWIGLICIIFSISASSEPVRDNSDLTQFDQPFLLGDWYLINQIQKHPKKTFWR